ncbi:MAG: AIR synthase related protein [Promethearchaeota archaeon]
MQLAAIVDELREHPPIKRKFALPGVIQRVRSAGYSSPDVIKSLGEDAALLDITGTDTLCVFTTDAIDQEFANASPWGAGYSGILVSVEDVYACGGTPKAASTSIAYRTNGDRDDILAGLSEASQKFRVPIVRGHTHEFASNNDVQVSLVGTVRRGSYISAGGAGPGQEIGLIFDPAGKPARVNPRYWDTTTHVGSERVLRKYACMPELGERRAVTACKDVSNGGIIGTILQMVEYSGVGASLDLGRFRVPDVVPADGETPALVNWLKMYLTTAFVTCFHSSMAGVVEEVVSAAGLQLDRIGQTTRGKRIILCLAKEKRELFDFESKDLTYSSDGNE